MTKAFKPVGSQMNCALNFAGPWSDQTVLSGRKGGVRERERHMENKRDNFSERKGDKYREIQKES